jgi:hypothetical protein
VGSVNELDTWIAAACTELGLQPGDVKTKAILDVARDVAHQVIRPGAPVSAYLMGLAVGRGADPSDVAARLSDLALAWPQRPDSGAAAQPADHTADQANGQPVHQGSGQPVHQVSGQPGNEVKVPSDDRVNGRPGDQTSGLTGPAGNRVADRANEQSAGSAGERVVGRGDDAAAEWPAGQLAERPEEQARGHLEPTS